MRLEELIQKHKLEAGIDYVVVENNLPMPTVTGLMKLFLEELAPESYDISYEAKVEGPFVIIKAKIKWIKNGSEFKIEDIGTCSILEEYSYEKATTAALSRALKRALCIGYTKEENIVEPELLMSRLEKIFANYENKEELIKSVLDKIKQGVDENLAIMEVLRGVQDV